MYCTYIGTQGDYDLPRFLDFGMFFFSFSGGLLSIDVVQQIIRFLGSIGLIMRDAVKDLYCINCGGFCLPFA